LFSKREAVWAIEAIPSFGVAGLAVCADKAAAQMEIVIIANAGMK